MIGLGGHQKKERKKVSIVNLELRLQPWSMNLKYNLLIIQKFKIKLSLPQA